MEKKICIRCGEEKALDMFYKHPGMKDGCLNKCKECCKKDNRENRSENVERYRAYDRKRAKTEKRKKAKKEYEENIKENNPERWKKEKRERNNRWRKKHPDRARAEDLVFNAVKVGVIIKPNECTFCKIKTDNLHAHHFDYSKPLEVIWLCPQCHAREHERIREEQRKNAV